MPKQIKPKVTFYIDKNNRNKKGLAPIKANITINYKNISRIVDHTLPTDWNPKQQRMRPPRPGKENNFKRINKKLDLLHACAGLSAPSRLFLTDPTCADVN